MDIDNTNLKLIESVCRASAITLNQVADECSSLENLTWEFSGRDILWELGKLECDIRKPHPENPFFDSLFSEIDKRGFKKVPVLYWFKIESPFVYDEFIGRYESVSGELGALTKEKGLRTLSAVKRRSEYQSYLYCGKVKKDFDLRMVVHLGYSKEGRTGGLQLCRWLPNHFPDMKFKLVAYKFRRGMEDLMGALEYQMAKNIQPVIGKHV